MKITTNGLKSILVRKSIEQQEVARIAGIHYNTVGMWVNSKRTAFHTLFKILSAAGLTTEQILNLKLGELFEIGETEDERIIR